MNTVRSIITLFILVSISVNFCQAQFAGVPPTEWQIKTAVLALPVDSQEEAKILGYDFSGELITLREGSNQFICLADDPNKEGFSVAAYHKDLEPFMARGRALKREGKESGEIFEIREKETKAGTLSLPDKSILYVATGDVDNAAEVDNLKVRYVVYIPFATAESTGLSPAPLGPGAPWIMNPGTHRAHIMITPE